MKLTVRASLAFKRAKTDSKPAFGDRVIECLTENAATFPALPVSVATLTDINNQLRSAIAAALSKDVLATAEVKVAVNQWDEAFATTAKYVSTVANGETVVVCLSGFIATKSETTPATRPAAITHFKATINGSKGAIIAGSQTAIPQAKAYVYVAAQDGVNVSYNEGVTVIQFGDKSVYIMADTQKQTQFFQLPSGVAFNVNMYAVNSAGSGPAAAASQQVVTQ